MVSLAMGEPSQGLRYLGGGDNVDYREYRRWKMRCQNQYLVMDKLPKSARGSFVWTLLQGSALEIVEHLKKDEYQKEGGEKVIFDLLDKRWPEHDRSDEMGELLRVWCARARET